MKIYLSCGKTAMKHNGCKSKRRPLMASVADPGCLSRMRIFSIPDPGSKKFRIRIKEFIYLTQKIVSKLFGNMSRVVHPGSGTWFFLSMPDPGSRGQKAPDHGSGPATLLIARCTKKLHSCYRVPGQSPAPPPPLALPPSPGPALSPPPPPPRSPAPSQTPSGWSCRCRRTFPLKRH